MKLSELLSKTAVGERKRGVCYQAYAEKWTLRYLKCFDENDNEFYIDVNDLKPFNGVINFKSTIKKPKDKPLPLRLGQTAFGEDGKFLGHVCDYILHGTEIKSIVVNNRKIPVERAICGDVVIIRKLKTTPHELFLGAVCS